MVMLIKRNYVEEAVERGMVANEKRPYMGCSGLGNKCNRKIWLDFRWVYDSLFEKRVLRIFERGDLEEPRVIRDLTNAGMVVSDTQLEFVDETGHIRGHCDGIVNNVPGAEHTTHLLEIKTMNSKRFELYKKQGLEKSNWGYWVQLHMYMGFAKLKRALFVTCNKDTEQRAYDRYHFDESIFNQHLRIGHRLLMEERPPEKIGNQMYFDCKYCPAYEYCHKDMPTNRNCRTCQFAELEMEGKWKCNFYNMEIDIHRQRVGCPDYSKMEVLK